MAANKCLLCSDPSADKEVNYNGTECCILSGSSCSLRVLVDLLPTPNPFEGGKGALS